MKWHILNFFMSMEQNFVHFCRRYNPFYFYSMPLFLRGRVREEKGKWWRKKCTDFSFIFNGNTGLFTIAPFIVIALLICNNSWCCFYLFALSSAYSSYRHCFYLKSNNHEVSNKVKKQKTHIKIFLQETLMSLVAIALLEN